MCIYICTHIHKWMHKWILKCTANMHIAWTILTSSTSMWLRLIFMYIIVLICMHIKVLIFMYVKVLLHVFSFVCLYICRHMHILPQQTYAHFTATDTCTFYCNNPHLIRQHLKASHVRIYYRVLMHVFIFVCVCTWAILTSSASISSSCCKREKVKLACIMYVCVCMLIGQHLFFLLNLNSLNWNGQTGMVKLWCMTCRYAYA